MLDHIEEAQVLYPYSSDEGFGPMTMSEILKYSCPEEESEIEGYFVYRMLVDDRPVEVVAKPLSVGVFDIHSFSILNNEESEIIASYEKTSDPITSNDLLKQVISRRDDKVHGDLLLYIDLHCITIEALVKTKEYDIFDYSFIVDNAFPYEA